MSHQLPGGVTNGRDKHPGGHAGHGNRVGHWLAMFACCVPMVLIVGYLYFRGAIGFGGVLAALVCVAIMPLMHGSMSHGEGAGHGDRP